MSTFEPNEEFVTLRDAMARLLEDSWVPSRRSQQQPGEAAGVRLPVDVYVTEEVIVVRASLPGLAPEDVEITLEDNALRIRGQFPEPEEGLDYVLRERACGCPFSRTLRLNVPVAAGEAEAEFEDGVLTLTLPKAEEVRPKVIQIKKE